MKEREGEEEKEEELAEEVKDVEVVFADVESRFNFIVLDREALVVCGVRVNADVE